MTDGSLLLDKQHVVLEMLYKRRKITAPDKKQQKHNANTDSLC